MNRRDFIKVSGALGVFLVTPRIGGGAALIEQHAKLEDINTVKITIHGLMKATDIFIVAIDPEDETQNEIIWRGQAKDEDTPVVAEVSPRSDGREIAVRTINYDALYQEIAIKANEDTLLHVLQQPEMNYYAAP